MPCLAAQDSVQGSCRDTERVFVLLVSRKFVQQTPSRHISGLCTSLAQLHQDLM